ncbi:MAG: O-antigen ligase family protein [Rhodothermaceae bacterium]|nr:O-antigen ligase family protein [Rhodothermaceae bacterium]
MNALNHSISYLTAESVYARIARFSFLIYLFFVIFGTMLPFQGSLQERGELGQLTDSNIVNQLLSLLFLLSFISLSGKLNAAFAFIQKEKFLTLFILWMLASVLWSPVQMVSLKRWITLFGEFVICLAALLHFKWSEEGLRAYRVVLFLYLPLTLLAVAFIPEAIQWQFPAWRGLAPTKNNLGQVAVFSILALFAIISYNRGRAVNVLHYGLLFMALAAYLGARSTTSFLVGFFLLFIFILVYLGRMISNKQLATYYAVFSILVFFSLLYITMVQSPEVIASVLGVFGKDLSFTGRVDLWSTVFEMTKGKMINGWGIGGFWVNDGVHLYPIYKEFIWLPNQSHQGYLDILNQTGVVGLSLLLLMIFGYLGKATSLKKRNVWIWFFLGILVYNFQESLFFRPRHIGHFMFMFAYMALHIDLLKEKGIIPVRKN